MERLWCFICQQGEDFLRCWWMVWCTQILVSAVQFRTDIIQGDTLVTIALQKDIYINNLRVMFLQKKGMK